MRAYYLTGFAAFAALGAQLAACGGSERSFDETGGTAGSSAGTGNASSGGSGNGGSGNGGSAGDAGSGNGGSGNGGSAGDAGSGNGGSGNGGSGGSAAGNGGTGGSTAGAGGTGGSTAGAGGTGGSTAGAGGTGGTGAASGAGGTGGSAGTGGSGGTAGSGGGTQTVQCDVDNSSPANSSDVIANVTITYDNGTMMWSDPAACDWDCNTNYCEDTGACLSSKQVPCDANNSNPGNSVDIDADVAVTCTGTTFSNPSKCLWMCNSSYCQEGNSCLTSKPAQCNINNSNPKFSTDVIANVNVSCGSGGIWGAPAACAWKCDANYCEEAGSCLTSKSVQCDPNNGNPKYSTDVIANVSISCNGSSWPSAPACAWTCNAGYVPDAAGTSCVRPIYMFDGGGVSGAIGKRAGADTMCTNARSATYPTLPSARVRGFISVTGSDEIQDMPANYGFSLTAPIVGPLGVKIADNWADLLDGTIDTTLTAAGVTSGFWYSGSSATGSVAPETCTAWTQSSGLSGRYGRGVLTDTGWITTGPATCGLSGYHVLCLASL